MKLIVKPRHITAEELNGFVKRISNDDFNDSCILNEEEFRNLDRAFVNLHTLPSSMRYFEELFPVCESISRKYGGIESTIVLGSSLITPILIGSQTHYRGKFRDTFFQIYHDSFRPRGELLIAGYKKNGESLGFALKRAMCAQSPDPEREDIGDFFNGVDPFEHFRERFALGPLYLLISDGEETRFLDYTPTS